MARLGTLIPAALALLIGAPAAHTAEQYRWSGTMSIAVTYSKADGGSFRTEHTGPIESTDWTGVAWFRPTALAYHDSSGGGDTCLSTSDLMPPDLADESVPIFVEWGRPRPGGSTALPRIIPARQEWAFPRHSWQCLAYDGGEVQRYEDYQDGLYGLEGAFTCNPNFDAASLDGVPFASIAASEMSPPLPGKEVQADGTIRFHGTVHETCRQVYVSSYDHHLTVTLDITGTPQAQGEALVSVSVDGPGGVTLPGGVSCDTDCSTKVPLGDAARVVADPLEPNDGFVGFRGCPGTVQRTPVPSCEWPATDDVELTAVFDPVVSYAPWVQFEADEGHWPMDPDEFVRRSSLNWANPDAQRRSCPAKDVRLASRHRVIASWLSKGRYTYRYCYLTGRGGAIKREQTMTSAQLTSPSEKRGKPVGGGQRYGFYLNLEDGAWKGVRPRSTSGGDYTNAPEMMVEYVPGRYIVYWFFYGRNHVKVAGQRDYHEGDWERIAVRLDADNKAGSVAYWQHYCGPDVHSWAKLKTDGAIAGRSHPRVYVAEGAHATYHKRGYTLVACGPLPRGVDDSHRGGGVTWQTWQSGADGFAEVTKKAWYGFGGGWGSRTAEGSGSFWGPLGPGPLKRAAPKGW